MGFGRQGQLGHGNYHSVEHPKMVEYADFRNYQPLQVSATYNSCIVLLSNKKLYWWGSNGTIDRAHTPTQVNINRKVCTEMIHSSRSSGMACLCL